MKNIIKLFTLVLGLVIAMPAFSASPTNDLGRCLVDSLNGKERKNLAKWIFFSIAAHPEIKPYSKASPKVIIESDKFIGSLVTRLLTVNCPKELQTAYKVDPTTVQKAFEIVGQVAMQEIMTNKTVMKALTNYAHYADIQKINKLLGQKQSAGK